MPSVKDFRRALRLAMKATATFIANASAKLEAGKMPLLDWRNKVAWHLKRLHSAAAVAAHYGTATISNEEKSAINVRLFEQLSYLDKAAAGAGGGPVAYHRLRMYIEAAHGSFEEARRRIMQAAGYRWERRVLSKAEHCEDCIAEARLGWQPIGSLRPIGAAKCLTNCRCYFQFAKYKRPEFNAKFSNDAHDEKGRFARKFLSGKWKMDASGVEVNYKPFKGSDNQIKEGIASGRFINEFESAIYDKDTEYMLVTNSGGPGAHRHVTAMRSNNRNEIAPIYGVGLFGSTVAHNHPDGDTLSIRDVTAMVRAGIRELRVVTPDKTVYSMRQEETLFDGKPSGIFLTPSYQTFQAHLREVLQRVTTKEECELSLEKQRESGLLDRVWKEFVKKPIREVAHTGQVREFRFSYTTSNLNAKFSNDAHDEKGRFARKSVSDPRRSWSDLQTFREVLAHSTQEVLPGVNVVEPYVFKVADGKAAIQKHLDAKYDFKSNSYLILKRELPPEKLEDRTYIHGSSIKLNSASDLRPGKSHGNFGSNEFNAIYLAQKGAHMQSAQGGSLWGEHSYEVKLKPNTRIALKKDIGEAWAKHPEMSKQEALEAEGYHGVAFLDVRGDVWELALFSNRLDHVAKFSEEFERKHPRKRKGGKGGGEFTKGSDSTSHDYSLPDWKARKTGFSISHPMSEEMKQLEKKLKKVGGRLPPFSVDVRVDPESKEIAQKVFTDLITKSDLTEQAQKAIFSSCRGGIHVHSKKSRLYYAFADTMIEYIPENTGLREVYAEDAGDKQIGGFYCRYTERLHLDGVHEGIEGHTFTDVAAHELGHAIDFYSDNPVSLTDEWKKAWRREICHPSYPLSSYAMTSEHEGFAEFCRLILTKGKKEAQKKFPRCTKVWEDKGFI